MNEPVRERPLASFHTFIGVIAGVVVLALVLAGLRSYRDLAMLRQREAALVERIAETDHRIESLQERIELLSDDAATQEAVAREMLGMVRPGEVVVYVDANEAGAQDSPTPGGEDGTVSPPASP